MAEASVVTGAGAQSGAMSFVAGRGECKEKKVALKIENFSEFLSMSNKQLKINCLTFEAGTCVLQDGKRTAATWKYHFMHTKDGEEDCIGGFLCLQNGKKAKALYSVSLSSGGKTIVSFTTDRKEFVTCPDCDWGFKKLSTKSEILQKTKGTDSLEVSLHLKVFSNRGFTPVLQAVSSSPSAVELKGQADSDFVKMLDSGDGADVEIKVPSEAGGEVDETSYSKMVHKAILMGRSSVFSKMFGKESEMVEAKTGKVLIKDLSPQGLGVFLHYLYTGKVLDEWVKVPEEILNCAEKYDLGILKQYCGRNLISAVSAGNSLGLYRAAKLHNLPLAKRAIAKFISKNMEAVLDVEDDDN